MIGVPFGGNKAQMFKQSPGRGVSRSNPRDGVQGTALVRDVAQGAFDRSRCEALPAALPHDEDAHRDRLRRRPCLLLKSNHTDGRADILDDMDPTIQVIQARSKPRLVCGAFNWFGS